MITYWTVATGGNISLEPVGFGGINSSNDNYMWHLIINNCIWSEICNEVS